MICPKCGEEYESSGHICRVNEYTLTETIPVRYGWVCPICNRVWSPDVLFCDCDHKVKRNFTASTVDEYGDKT